MSGRYPTQPGPFDIKAHNGGIVGSVVVYPDGFRLFLQSDGPYGREDLRSIAHRLMNIADFDTGLQE